MSSTFDQFKNEIDTIITNHYLHWLDGNTESIETIFNAARLANFHKDAIVGLFSHIQQNVSKLQDDHQLKFYCRNIILFRDYYIPEWVKLVDWDAHLNAVVNSLSSGLRILAAESIMYAYHRKRIESTDDVLHNLCHCYFALRFLPSDDTTGETKQVFNIIATRINKIVDANIPVKIPESYVHFTLMTNPSQYRIPTKGINRIGGILNSGLGDYYQISDSQLMEYELSV